MFLNGSLVLDASDPRLSIPYKPMIVTDDECGAPGSLGSVKLLGLRLYELAGQSMSGRPFRST